MSTDCQISTCKSDFPTQNFNFLHPVSNSLQQVPRYDADRLVGKLVQKCRSASGFDWLGLGQEAGVCFNAVPSGVSFLNGPLTDGKEVQVRQRTKRSRHEEDEEEREAKEEKPEDVKGHTARNADSLGSVEKSMIILEQTLKKKVDSNYKALKRQIGEDCGGEDEIPKPVAKRLKKVGTEICAVQYLVNPQSFTQTVENIFHFAFCIKKGSASIAAREAGEFEAPGGVQNEGGPRVKYSNSTKNETGKARQTIVSLTMKDWRDLCEAYDVAKGDLPHRTGSSQKRPTKRAPSASQLPSSQESS